MAALKRATTIFLHLTLLLCFCHCDIYVDYGDPYELGEFNTTLTFFSSAVPGPNSPPIHTTAYYPTTPGDYAVIYYVTGFGGVAPPQVYRDFHQMVASHGYIVFSQWNLLGEDGPEIGPDVHFRQIDWLRENTPGRMGGTEGDFDYLSFSCHSSGCAPVLKMMMNDSSAAMAVANVEPVSFAIIDAEVEYTAPTLNYGTEWANLTCAFPGVDFLAWQEKTQCPKIMMETADAGHCDVLDLEAWQSCQDFCFTTDDSYLWEYKMMLQGVVSAFLTAYVQGNGNQLEYITDADKIPWKLNKHETVIDC